VVTPIWGDLKNEHFLAFFGIFSYFFVKIHTFLTTDFPKDTGKQTSGNDTGDFTDRRRGLTDLIS
jgi:hypothetical protein